MKRMVSLLLTAALAAGLALPAAAAEPTQDQRLAQVTQKVKEVLDLDTTAYDSFSGECYDQRLVSQWSLYWEGPEGRLSVDALEDGTVTWYSLYQNETEGPEYGLPGYPSGDPAQAQAAAQAFVDKVLEPGLETAVLEESSSSAQLGRDELRFTGDILFHGLPSP